MNLADSGKTKGFRNNFIITGGYGRPDEG